MEKLPGVFIAGVVEEEEAAAERDGASVLNSTNLQRLSLL